jgi:fumarylacetoacetase
MPFEINETHNPDLKSWVESSNDPASDFPIQNLPFCTFSFPVDVSPEEGEEEDEGDEPGANTVEDHGVGVVIGDQVLDLYECAAQGLIEPDEAGYLADEEFDDLYFLLDLPPAALSHLRRCVSDILNKDSSRLKRKRIEKHRLIRPLSSVTLQKPVIIHDYTDFYASIHHATRVGSMFRPESPLLPNYKWVPIGYHGRASSIIASGTDVRRPRGQMKADDAPGEFAPPVFGPCRMLDYELEVGFIVGGGNEQGQPIGIEQAEEALFGVCLLNDWSARDIQKWEYQPLGPFLAKNFASSVSNVVVTMEALAPFRCAAMARPAGDPQPLGYLRSARDQAQGGIDIQVEALLATKQMRERGVAAQRVSIGALKDLYWTAAQLVTHHASNGCNLQPGDLLGSGTISGETPESCGCLLERTWAGRDAGGKPLPRRALKMPTGEERLFLEDGDEVILRGWAERAGYRRIGLGECRGIVTPAE